MALCICIFCFLSRLVARFANVCFSLLVLVGGVLGGSCFFQSSDKCIRLLCTARPRTAPTRNFYCFR